MADIEKVMTEMQEEFFNIIGDIKLFLDNDKEDKAKEYVTEQYNILKKELFPDYQSEK